jgi:NADPH-dependent FMN reductase
MAHAVAEGARSNGAHVDVKRVPELVPEHVAKSSNFKLDQAAPVAKVDDLADYDAIIIGTPTRYGNMTAQMKNFGVHFERDPARRAGDDDPDIDSRALAPRHDLRRIALQFRWTIWRRGSQGMLALGRIDDRRRRRIAPAFEHRARGRALPGRVCREIRRETGGLIRPFTVEGGMSSSPQDGSVKETVRGNVGCMADDAGRELVHEARRRYSGCFPSSSSSVPTAAIRDRSFGALKKGLARANFETINRLAHLEAALAVRKRAAAESPTPYQADARRSPLVAHTR